MSQCWEFPPKCQVCSVELTHHGEIVRGFYTLTDTIPLGNGTLCLPDTKNKYILPFYVIKLFEPDENGEFAIIHHDNLIRIGDTN